MTITPKLYVVRYQTADAPGHTQTDDSGPRDYSFKARQRRDHIFADRPEITHCWIEMIRGERTLARYGAVLKRVRTSHAGRRCSVQMRTDHHPLVRELDEEITQQKQIDSTLTDSAILRSAGVGVAYLSQLRRGVMPTLATFDAVLGALGYRLAIVEDTE